MIERLVEFITSPWVARVGWLVMLIVAGIGIGTQQRLLRLVRYWRGEHEKITDRIKTTRIKWVSREEHAGKPVGYFVILDMTIEALLLFAALHQGETTVHPMGDENWWVLGPTQLHIHQSVYAPQVIAET